MPDTIDTTLHLLAQAETQPVETDASVADGPAYDAGLLADLDEHGPDALQEWGMIVVRDIAREDRYNAAVWWALAHDLAYENKGDSVVITDPTMKGAA